MEFLLLGGTGAIGIHLAKLLAESGNIVYVTSRQQRENEKNIIYHMGNAKHSDFINPILKSRRWNAIVDFMCYQTDEFKNRVIDLLSSTDQYVFLSSARVYAESNEPINEQSSRLLDVSEDYEFLSKDDYALYKAREENILQKCETNNYTIIRPYITYSEIRLPLGILEKETWAYRAIHGRSIVIPKNICQKLTSLAYGLDVSKAIAQLIGNKYAIGQTYNITSSKSETWEEVLTLYVEEIESHLGKTPKIVMVNNLTNSNIRCLFKKYIRESIFRLMPNKTEDNINYQYNYDRLFNRTFDNHKLNDLLVDLNFSDYQIQLRKCLQSFIEHQHYDYINWKLEALHDRIGGDKTPLSEINNFKDKFIYVLIRYIIPLKIN